MLTKKAVKRFMVMFMLNPVDKKAVEMEDSVPGVVTCFVVTAPVDASTIIVIQRQAGKTQPVVLIDPGSVIASTFCAM